MMRKRITIFLMLISIFMSGCTQIEKEEKSFDSLSFCDKISSEDLKLRCYAIVRRNPFICDEISYDEIKDHCYADVARANKDASICDKIPDRWIPASRERHTPRRRANLMVQASCYTNVYKTFNKDTDIKECYRRENSSLCLYYLAKARKDESLCKKITNDRLRGNCYTDIGILTENILLCQLANYTSQRDKCYRKIAVSTRNPAVCERISEENDVFTCIAEATGDDTYCEKITDEREKDYCYRKLRKCAKVKHKAVRNSCYRFAAIEINNSLLCKKIEPGDDRMQMDYKDECFSTIAKATKNSDLCNEIQSDPDRFECLRDAATAPVNPDICKDTDFPVHCYRAIAVGNKDPQLCYNLEDNFFVNVCLSDTIIAKGDPYLCEIINHTRSRDECYFGIIRKKEAHEV